MNFPAFLLWVFVCFLCVLCERHSETLHETFKKESTDLRNQDKEKKINVNVPIDLVTKDEFEKFFSEHFSVFTSAFGRRPTFSAEIPSTRMTEKTSTTISTEDSSEESETEEKTETSRTTETAVETLPETNNTEKISTEIVTGETLTETSSAITTLVQAKTTEMTTFSNTEKKPDSTTAKYTPEIGFSSTTEFHQSVNSTCEPNEFYFNDHCYFVKFIEKEFHVTKYDLKTQRRNLKEKILISDLVNSTKNCQRRHPKALGLAVETEEENKFILSILKTVRFYNNYTIFTSGIRANGFPDKWRGWNLKINQSVLNFGKNNSQSNYSFYCIDACNSYWYLFSPKMSHLLDLNCFVICERPYNPKNIQLELHKQCLELYRNSSCYNLEKHSNFCCEKDETGEIWFACPNKTSTKAYPSNLECSWTCKSEGFFIRDRPTCRGIYSCNDSYNNIGYIAPVTRYALSDCPERHSGHSAWYCSRNGTFLGKPDYSLCCQDTNLQCRDVDAFLNIWMGCPSRKVRKRTACPPGTNLEEAFAEWYCQKNGTFNGTSPDYSNCNAIKIECSKRDRHGVDWVTPAGTTGKKGCPPPSIGFCFWKCKNSGKFDGPEPDCSKCKAAWMEEIAQKIKNHSDHEEIMKMMENHTRKEDLSIGYRHVLALTDDCIVLFKKQNSKCDVDGLEKFLKSYSKILKNVAGNPNLWSSFSVSNREEYAERILQITQKAAFANLDSKNWSSQTYNATFAKFEEDGFDFFVAYNPLELKFPLENFSQSNWHLDVKEIGERNFSAAFAVMGLVMTYSLSSLMFPQGNKTENLEMNSPAVTFTVAARKNGEVVFDPNVVVSISFKHRNRTRLPQTEIIRRKLHEREQPSGVFNSTLCYYYRNAYTNPRKFNEELGRCSTVLLKFMLPCNENSDWNTEGCFVTFTSKDRTNCTCNHLSTIGLLMSIHKYKPNKTLEFVSVVSSSITILSLILTLLVFYFFDGVKNDRVFIGKNLCFCLLIGHAMLITVMDKKFFNIPDNFCTIYAVLLHYVFMAAFAWMLVEGYHLYRMLILVFDSDIEYRWMYLLIGYGGPFIIVAVTKVVGFLFQEQPYGQDELCWLKPPNYVWAFIGPVIASTSINLCILITSMKLAISSKRRTEKFSFATLKLWIKGWISLSTLLGITWLFGLAYIHYNEMFVYIFVVFNGFQGFFIFIFRCVLCEQYKTIFSKKVKSWFSKSRLKGSKKSENVKSETKLYAMSATKSSEEMEAKDSGYDPGLDTSEDCKKSQNSLEKSPRLTTRAGNKPGKNSCEVDIDINITLMPALSESYLRNRAIARNFSTRKSKATWLAESQNFPELSYHNIYHPN